MPDSPIAIFDSGLGGLTVLRTLCDRFPQENFIYLGDTARLPYGSKSKETIKNYNFQNIKYLKQFKPKLIIVACNSASSVLSEDDSTEIPTIGVIEPAAKMAAKLSKNGRIGVIGTRATVTAKTYVEKIKALNNEIDVYQQSCPLFVPLVEEGWLDDPVTNLIVYRHIQPLVQAQVDTIILGCTHYPLLKLPIAKVAGPEVALVDSSEALADLLEEKELVRPSDSASPGQLQIMCTDTASHFKLQAETILGTGIIDGLEKIDL